MATWRVKTPDGREYDVETPDGASENDAIAYVRDNVEPKEAAPAPAPMEQRSMTRDALRMPGLAARYVIEGAAGLPAMFVDPFQKLTGMRGVSEATSSMLDRFGLPKPETPAEEIGGAGARAVTGGGLFAKAAGMLPQLANAPKYINNIMAQKPGLQAVQAGIGGLASETTRQAGGGPMAQLFAGALTPMVASSTANIIGATARGGRELVRPLTQAGSEQIAADVIGRTTADKVRSLSALDEFLGRRNAGQQVGVPGTKPTAGAVTGDYGVIGAEQLASRGPANPDFALRLAQNNERMIEDLARLKATPETVAAFIAKREELTTPLREQAFAGAKGPVDYGPVAEELWRLAKTPEGGRENSRKAIDWLVTQIKLYADDGRTSPQHADALRMDIGDLVAGKINNEKGSMRLAAGVANEVKKVLTQQIELSAPGFKKYLEAYSRLSKPIERLEVLSDTLGGKNLSKVTNALPLVGEEGAAFRLSQAKMRNAVTGLDEKLPVSPRGLPLAPRQRDILGRVSGELNAQEVAARGGKPPGSDTYQNMATANLLSSIFGEQIAKAGFPKAVSGPINFATRGLEPRIRDIIDNAYLNPEEYARLLRMARTMRRSPTFGSLATTAGENIYGGLLGNAVNQ